MRARVLAVGAALCGAALCAVAVAGCGSSAPTLAHGVSAAEQQATLADLASLEQATMSYYAAFHTYPEELSDLQHVSAPDHAPDPMVSSGTPAFRLVHDALCIELTRRVPVGPGQPAGVTSQFATYIGASSGGKPFGDPIINGACPYRS